MAPTETITLRAKAKRLNISNYKAMSLDELRAAVKAASDNGAETAVDNGASKSSGRKSAPTVEAAKPAPKKRTSTGRKKKAGTAKSAPASPQKRKPAQRKSAAANKGTAKRQTTGKKKSSTARKSGNSPTRAGKAPAKRSARVDNADAGRQMIEAGEIDWTAESSVGADPTSTRGIVMKELRRKKGNIQKVYDALADRAKELFGVAKDGHKRNKDESLTQLRWYIGSTRFAFVKSTDQHPEADNPAYLKAAKKRVRASSGKATPAKRTGGARKAKTASTGRKPARPARGAQRPAQSRKRATAKRSTAKRASTSRKAKTAAALKRG